ncbi:MAG: acyl-CoA synthetase FdrA [Alphaproteobacteria bacterium]|nr:acyl-CoA synthetase FdrA [Alphaproteobacteria bacterium]
MNTSVVNAVRMGFYLDSVALMRLSRTIANRESIEDAALMMGTPANRQIMADAGLLSDTEIAARGGDLVIGVRGKTLEAAEAALAEALAQLDQPMRGSGDANAWRPKTLRSAVKAAPDATLALISVPGDFAIAEARKAVRRGLHVMIFSDNVSLAAEAELKREARDLGRLVMGPDCGTAIINGTPLAFANAVPRGDIGIVGASGTGTQEVSCLIARHGGGISHAIGVGSRDLQTVVGGISTLMAIDALDADPATNSIVLVSKPPPEAVAARVLDRLATGGTPATVCFIGAEELPMPPNVAQVFTLKDAAAAALGLDAGWLAETPPPALTPSTGGARVHGLFSGGTLCAEAQAVFRGAGVAVSSNVPIPGASMVGRESDGHLMLDLGDDEYTQGRPHPMIDPSVRDTAIVETLDDARVGVILVDVVIGYGSHDDPAGHLAKLLTARRPNGPAVIASVTGTEDDPQSRSTQLAKLETVGVHVAPTNADAAVWALAAVRSDE